MSGDYSRQRFDPRNHFSAVLMQQGRVQLDSDWNEMAELFDRRFRAERVDTLGRTVVPRETPDAFRISLADDQLRLGRGRIYVDGLLAENHGAGPPEVDPVLGELRGSLPHVAYAAQPYFAAAALHPPPGPGAGRYLVYLDVWQRERTFLENPGLVEPALGIDTTTRLQTVWQVRLLENVAADLGAATDEPRWNTLVAPSAARLTTDTGNAVQADVDPCLIPPGGGYQGLENRLYRVEIHDPGPIGTATFKWSRDNAAVATNVVAVAEGRAQITVVRTGRDSLLRFNRGDWIEITDDRREEDGRPGLMRRVTQVDDDARTLLLDNPLPDPEFAAGPADPARHLRVRRWDQHGQVILDDGQTSVVVDLDTDPAGVIPVPANGAFVVLENGIKVALTFEPGPGAARFGDHWTFAARTEGASIERLDHAPPRGLHHHYARLGVVNPDTGTATDFRTFWPPTSAGGGDCTRHVTAAGHNSRDFTIQKALDEVRLTGGSVCLGEGIFYIGDDALRVEGARAVTLHGQGATTVLIRQRPGKFAPFTPQNSQTPIELDAVGFDPNNLATLLPRSALRVENSAGVTVSDLVIVGSASAGLFAPLVSVRNTAGFTLERCFLLHLAGRDTAPTLLLGGILLDTTVRDNVLVAKVGISARERGLFADLRIEDNLLASDRIGIQLDASREPLVFTRTTRIAGNTLAGQGIRVSGLVHRGHTVAIERNALEVNRTGICTQASHTTIAGNTVLGPAARAQIPPDGPDEGPDTRSHGILLQPHELGPYLDDCLVEGNTVRNFWRGVASEAAPRRLTIAGNTLGPLDQTGVHVTPPPDAACLGRVDVRGNTIDRVGNDNGPAFPETRLNDPKNQSFNRVSGVFVETARDVAVTDNTISRVGGFLDRCPDRTLIRCIEINTAVTAAIRGNRIHDFGPLRTLNLPEATGIHCSNVFAGLSIESNRVTIESQKNNKIHHAALQVINADTPDTSYDTAFGDPNYVYLISDRRILEVVAHTRAYLVRGNHLEAAVGRSFVHLPNDDFRCVSVRTFGGNLIFADNQVFMLFTGFTTGLNTTFGRLEVHAPAPVRVLPMLTLLGNQFERRKTAIDVSFGNNEFPPQFPLSLEGPKLLASANMLIGGLLTTSLGTIFGAANVAFNAQHNVSFST